VPPASGRCFNRFIFQELSPSMSRRALGARRAQSNFAPNWEYRVMNLRILALTALVALMSPIIGIGLSFLLGGN